VPAAARDFLKISLVPEKGLAVLEVLRDSVEMSEWESFVRAGAQLVGSGQKHMVLDLRRLKLILSLFIGEAVRLSGQARARGGRFTVLAAGRIGDTFRMILGADVLEIVTDGRNPEQLGDPGRGPARSRPHT
jgi:hypothetical protein